MSEPHQLTILCLAGDVKGQEFIRECARQGCRVLLVTREALKHEDWPHDAIGETYYMPSLLRRDDLLKGVSYLARTQVIDRIVPLDDFDVDTAALLREHLRIPGMGDTTARYFRDKLAMRVRALEAGILVPEFVHVLNYGAIRRFMEHTEPPWMLKPRSEAAAAGIKKVREPEQLWALLDEFGDQQSFYVLEQFVPGEIYHVDAIVSEREVVFVECHQYGRPPLDVVHGGGLFTTRTLARDSAEWRALVTLNRELIAALGFVRGVTHTEFIRSHADGRFYFLETAARVGGAHIAETIEAATGVNLWAEWAKIEIGAGKSAYEPPTRRHDYGGIILSLARQEWPDTSAYDDPEIVWRMNKRHHAGLIVASPDPRRVEALLENYNRRFYEDFFASQPGLEKMPR